MGDGQEDPSEEGSRSLSHWASTLSPFLDPNANLHPKGLAQDPGTDHVPDPHLSRGLSQTVSHTLSQTLNQTLNLCSESQPVRVADRPLVVKGMALRLDVCHKYTQTVPSNDEYTPTMSSNDKYTQTPRQLAPRLLMQVHTRGETPPSMATYLCGKVSPCMRVDRGVCDERRQWKRSLKGVRYAQRSKMNGGDQFAGPFYLGDADTHPREPRVEEDGTLHLATASNITGRSSSPPWSSWTRVLD